MRFMLNKDMEVKILPKYSWKIIVMLLLCLGSVGVSIYSILRQPEIKHIYHKITETEEHTDDVPLNDTAILKELVSDGCVLANIGVAQAKIESNLGQSSVGKNAKNLFGITHHRCKYVSGKYGVYAKYNTYRDNIKCYIHIQDYYLRNIDGKYAEAGIYIEKLKEFK